MIFNPTNTRAVIKLEITPAFNRVLAQPMSRGDIETLAKSIDTGKFAGDGSLTRAIQGGGAPGAVWKPLTERYVARKKALLGKPWPGEKVPPKVGIDTKIWIRTGKALEFTSTTGKGRLKQTSIRWRNFLGGRGPFYAVYVKKIDYLLYANVKRPLIYWYPEDQAFMQAALDQMIRDVSRRYNLQPGGVRRAAVAVGA